ncbi:MAG: protein jag [Anaerolineales bacterium]|nr:protein jag [Anaerolineales bacterium]
MSTPKPSIEIIAPTVEEAIQKGAAELNVPADSLDIEVMDQGGRGFLGLRDRQVRVRLTLKSSEEDAPAEPLFSGTASTLAPEDEDEAERVSRETVSELLSRMGIEARVVAAWGDDVEDGRIRPLHVEIHGDDLSILIGRRAETLSSLQYISRLIVGKELQQPVAVLIDVEGYRARREQQIRRLAKRMAHQAVETGRALSLEPMPANERRIVHIELREDPSVETESVGEGNRRKVTIIPVQ